MTEPGQSTPHPSDDLAAYALGALAPGEEERVRDHLADCERCRSELGWLRPAVDALPASVPQVDPPASLKRNLMREVRADARAERGGWWSRRAGWITLRARPALAVAAVGLLGAGVAGYVISEAGDGSAPAVTQVAVETTPLADEASGVLERSGSEATLTVAGMEPLEGGRVYQLWYSDDGEVEPGASFTPDPSGEAEADLGAIPAAADQVLVTEETEPGLASPRGDVLLSAPLT
jgi:anti-sigma-K factor RskA